MPCGFILCNKAVLKVNVIEWEVIRINYKWCIQKNKSFRGCHMVSQRKSSSSLNGRESVPFILALKLKEVLQV